MDWQSGGSALPQDSVEILGISALGHHGVLESERAVGQPFTVDVRLRCDTRKAAASDWVEDAVDYAEVARRTAEVITGEPVCLIETLAHRIADAVFEVGDIPALDIAVHKPSAPLGVTVRDVIVRIRRTREVEGVPTPPAPRPREPESGPHVDIAALQASGVPLTRRAIAEAKAQSRASHVGNPPVLVGNPQRRPTLRASQAPATDLDTPPREAVDVILSLGGNLGDTLAALRGAVDDLASVPGIDILGVSPLARTRPVAIDADQDFFNAVVAIRTTLAPRALLHTVQGIEAQHGREHSERSMPRPLDIDIVAYDTLIARDEELELPHPRANKRAFVLLPWATLSPHAFLPGVDGGPVAMLAEHAPDRDGVRWLALDWLTVPVALSGAMPRPPEAMERWRM